MLSSSVVCEIGPVRDMKNDWGQVEVEVKGEKRGTSSMVFTYRVNTLSAHPRTQTILSLSLFLSSLPLLLD